MILPSIRFLWVSNIEGIKFSQREREGGETSFPCSSNWIPSWETLIRIFAHEWKALSWLWLFENSQIRKTRVGPSAYTSYPTFATFMSLSSPNLFLLSLEFLFKSIWDANLSCVSLWKGFHVRTLSKLISRGRFISTRKISIASNYIST